MSRRSSGRRPGRSPGFGLKEALVTLTLLVIVMVTSMTMLFQMRAFAERQQTLTAPQRIASRALDYLTYYVSGAADTNLQDPRFPNPNALVQWYDRAGVPTQASYNNVTDRYLADPGTDVITVAFPVNPRTVTISSWPALAKDPRPVSSLLWVDFWEGCPAAGRPVPPECAGTGGLGDACNLLLFRNLTGAHPVAGGERSNLLQLYDSTGRWVYGVINGYNPSNSPGCAVAADPMGARRRVIEVSFLPGDATSIALPRGQTATLRPPVYIAGGIEYRSFRVIRSDVNDPNSPSNLEQKVGLFDRNTDNPYPPPGSTAEAFTPVIENVEDLQVAYLIRNDAAGTVEEWNTRRRSLPVADGGIPQQAGPFGAPPVDGRDIVFVLGVRLSVVGRSFPLALSGVKLTSLRRGALHFRPPLEDRPRDGEETGPGDATRESFWARGHHRQTATVFLRNRMLGN